MEAIGRFGAFDSELILYDTDGTTQLAVNSASPIASGQLGSFVNTDAFIQYDFPDAGVYFIEVKVANDDLVPPGATYELKISVEGGEVLTEVIFKDSFEDPPLP